MKIYLWGIVFVAVVIVGLVLLSSRSQVTDDLSDLDVLDSDLTAMQNEDAVVLGEVDATLADITGQLGVNIDELQQELDALLGGVEEYESEVNELNTAQSQVE